MTERPCILWPATLKRKKIPNSHVNKRSHTFRGQPLQNGGRQRRQMHPIAQMSQKDPRGERGQTFLHGKRTLWLRGFRGDRLLSIIRSGIIQWITHQHSTNDTSDHRFTLRRDVQTHLDGTFSHRQHRQIVETHGCYEENRVDNGSSHSYDRGFRYQ